MTKSRCLTSTSITLAAENRQTGDRHGVIVG